MASTDGKPEPFERDPEKLARLLEIELMQKRAAWQRTSAHRTTFRALAILFLVVIIAGALAAYYFLVMEAPSRGDSRSPAATQMRR